MPRQCSDGGSCMCAPCHRHRGAGCGRRGTGGSYTYFSYFIIFHPSLFSFIYWYAEQKKWDKTSLMTLWIPANVKIFQQHRQKWPLAVLKKKFMFLLEQSRFNQLCSSQFAVFIIKGTDVKCQAAWLKVSERQLFNFLVAKAADSSKLNISVGSILNLWAAGDSTKYSSHNAVMQSPHDHVLNQCYYLFLT